MRPGGGSALLLLALPWPLVLALLWVDEEEEVPSGVSSGFDDSPSVKCAGRPLA